MSNTWLRQILKARQAAPADARTSVTSDLTLSVAQISVYYGARWRSERGFRQIKQEIGSVERMTFMRFTDSDGYREDIDGLRAIAVLAVVAFHFGILPNGYLGVDVFFVISGFLITGIIYKDLDRNDFSVVDFYVRRTRRILPLTLFLVLVSVIVGTAVMLPDDLENLAESAVATNLFGNNILQAITTRNYWDVVNEYKPLIHTWSLSMEEQYYMVYPLLLLLIGGTRGKWLLPTLSLLGILSLALYLLPFKEHEKFYYLPFRFFELAAGGVAALHLREKTVVHTLAGLYVSALILVLLVDPVLLPRQLALPITVIITLGILVTDTRRSNLAALVLHNRIFIGIGLISFSLYMWHQVILSFARYFVLQRMESIHLISISVLMILLSVASYHFIEIPFRNRAIISNRKLFPVLGVLFVATTIPSLFIYWKGGVIRDVPELGITKTDAIRGIHAKYNARIFAYDKQFSGSAGSLKVLVIGNSFGRDWANVLLESRFQNSIDLSYIADPLSHPEFQSRATTADIIFFSTATREGVARLGMDMAKLYVVGTKNFGANNGYFYNYSGDDYFAQRTFMEPGTLEYNEKLMQWWGDRYIDLISKIINEQDTVPVFTPDRMFISQDCRHFTRAGAVYFASLFEDELTMLFK